MWTTFIIALSISLATGYFFFTAHNRRTRVLEGIVAAGSMMICLAIAPFSLKVLLLLFIFAMEQWRVQWEKARNKA